MRWLLDTDTVIALLRGSSPRLDRRVNSRPVGQIGLSSITLAELHFGVARSSRPRENANALTAFLESFVTAPFDTAAASAYGPVRRRLSAGGTPIGPLDTLIAAHALALAAVLVTRNVREFRRVGGLRVENWLAP
ncbi:MAG: PIN domain-containing protein [Steroidobacteraceae bacterium]